MNLKFCQQFSRVLVNSELQNLLIKPSHPAKKDLNKKWLPKQKIIHNFNIDAQGFRKTRNGNPPTREIGATSCADQSAIGSQVGWHGLAGNAYFLHGWIFISCVSEPLGINIEILNGLLLW